MTALEEMFKAKAAGATEEATNQGVNYLAECASEVRFAMQMRNILGIKQSEGVTRALTCVIITAVVLSKRDRSKFSALLDVCREFLVDDEGCAAMFDLFKDYPMEGPDAGTADH